MTVVHPESVCRGRRPPTRLVTALGHRAGTGLRRLRDRRFAEPGFTAARMGSCDPRHAACVPARRSWRWSPCANPMRSTSSTTWSRG
jgi:hypothetical protein